MLAGRRMDCPPSPLFAYNRPGTQADWIRQGADSMREARVLLAAALLVGMTIPMTGGEPATGERPGLDPSDLDRPAVVDSPVSPAVRAERRRMAAALASQLGSPQFEVREDATRKLEQFGMDAIDSLTAAAAGES